MKRFVQAMLALATLAHGAAPAAPRCAITAPVLSSWRTLSGALLEAEPHQRLAPVFQIFMAPVALAVQGNWLWVADAGQRKVFLLDQARPVMFAIPDYVPQTVTTMLAGPDLSLYVADSAARRVLRFGFDGRPMPGYADAARMARPVGLALDPAQSNLLVADSLYRQVLVFGSLGNLREVVQTDAVRSIDAMVQGPDGLYLVDRVQRQVVVTGADGAERYAFGQGTLGMPGKIAVDRHNRVFVSDDQDQTIKVYANGALVDAGQASSKARFVQIAGLALDQNILYVADRANGRIVLLRIAPPCAPGGGDD